MPTITIDQALTIASEHRRAGRLADAESVYRHILAAEPSHPAALGALGGLAESYVAAANALKDKRQLDQAIAFYQRAIAIKPHHLVASNNLAVALCQAGHIGPAIAAFTQILAANPNAAEAHFNLGVAHDASGQTDQAIACYQRALAIKPDYAEALNNLATVFAERAQWDQAIAAFRQAIVLRPAFAGAHYNLSHALLRLGDFARGWPEFEWRWACPGLPPARVFSQPLWNGSSIPDSTILLTCEQGRGDAIQFARYATMVADRCQRVVLECQMELLPLLHGIRGVHEVIAQHDPLPDFDAHCSLLSLPGIFATTVDSIPADIPYLRPDPTRTADWANRLGSDPRFKIGLAWAGNPSNPFDRHRSCPLSAFAPLAEIPGVVFHSLQKGPPSEQAVAPPTGIDLIDHSAHLHDFADTAALVANLDLVITVDTAIAHLAGGMGSLVWTLLVHVADWRWLIDRDDSPWYPTMRLFRQPSAGDWTAVLRRIADELHRHRAARS